MCPSCSLTLINGNLGDKEKLYLTLTPSALWVFYTIFNVLWWFYLFVLAPCSQNFFLHGVLYTERTRFHLPYVSHVLTVLSPDPKFWEEVSRCCPGRLKCWAPAFLPSQAFPRSWHHSTWFMFILEKHKHKTKHRCGKTLFLLLFMESFFLYS